MFIIFIGIIIAALVIALYYLEKSKPAKTAKTAHEEMRDDSAETRPYTYRKKGLMSESEKDFHQAILYAAGTEFVVLPQVNLATIIKKEGDFKYQNELYRNIDFGVFDRDYNIIVLVEINDVSHYDKARKARDAKVHAICKEASIPIITLHTDYGVNQDYINKRIHEYTHKEIHTSTQ